MASAVLFNLNRQRKAAGAVVPCALRELRPAQPAARRKQRYGLKKIGLAGAILAAEDDKAAVNRHIERRVGAKIPQYNAAHLGATPHGAYVVGAGHGYGICHVRRGRESGTAAS